MIIEGSAIPRVVRSAIWSCVERPPLLLRWQEIVTPELLVIGWKYLLEPIGVRSAIKPNLRTPPTCRPLVVSTFT
jgi:hypothetical protein